MRPLDDTIYLTPYDLKTGLLIEKTEEQKTQKQKHRIATTWPHLYMSLAALALITWLFILPHHNPPPHLV